MRFRHILIIVSIIIPLTSGCARSNSNVRTAHAEQAPRGKSWHGIASWYGRPFNGRRTASGEVFDMHKYTAAHKTLPFGTRLRVTNLRNGRQTLVRINDRGPYVVGREIDLSYVAARDIGILEKGLEKVRLEILSK
jgi:rare lipoprotein A